MGLVQQFRYWRSKPRVNRL